VKNRKHQPESMEKSGFLSKKGWGFSSGVLLLSAALKAVMEDRLEHYVQ
jgi:hypothetical protein